MISNAPGEKDTEPHVLWTILANEPGKDDPYIVGLYIDGVDVPCLCFSGATIGKMWGLVDATIKKHHKARVAKFQEVQDGGAE